MKRVSNGFEVMNTYRMRNPDSNPNSWSILQLILLLPLDLNLSEKKEKKKEETVQLGSLPIQRRKVFPKRRNRKRKTTKKKDIKNVAPAIRESYRMLHLSVRDFFKLLPQELKQQLIVCLFTSASISAKPSPTTIAAAATSGIPVSHGGGGWIE